MYTSTNYKTKKALKEAVLAGTKVSIFAPGMGNPVRDGVEYIEGPHYPKPHSWYAEVLMKDGYVVNVK
jgi:hypothetical protein